MSGTGSAASSDGPTLIDYRLLRRPVSQKHRQNEGHIKQLVAPREAKLKFV